METISIWPERSGGQDPTSHFWFESGGIPLRICDGETRLAGADRSPEVYAPCRSCKDLYLEDVLYGRKVFAILTEPPESHRHPSLNGVYSPKNLGYTPFKEGCMVRISVGLFAKFYEVRPAGQVHIVRDLRMRLANPKGYMLRDFYGSLRSTLRGTHWTTGDITTFENALPASVDSQKQEQRKEHYRDIGERYIEFWRTKNANYFQVPTIDVEIGGLVIVVGPEVGMRTDDGYQALKLWFNSKPPSVQARQVIVYLMNLAKDRSAGWSERWHSGIWDIRRENIPLPVSPARDFELGLSGQVAAFLQIWNQLDEQAQRAEKDGGP